MVEQSVPRRPPPQQRDPPSRRGSLRLGATSGGIRQLGGRLGEGRLPTGRSELTPSVTAWSRMIPPSLQREISERVGSTVVETSGSHSIYVSQPAVLADLIERAASEVESPAMA